MDLIDLEDDTIDAEVMDSLAVTMDNFRVSYMNTYLCHNNTYVCWLQIFCVPCINPPILISLVIAFLESTCLHKN